MIRCLISPEKLIIAVTFQINILERGRQVLPTFAKQLTPVQERVKPNPVKKLNYPKTLVLQASGITVHRVKARLLQVKAILAKALL